MPDFFAGVDCAFAALLEVAFATLPEVAIDELLCELAAGVFLEVSEEDCVAVAEGCADCSLAGPAEENAAAKDSIRAQRENETMHFLIVGNLRRAGCSGNFSGKRREIQKKRFSSGLEMVTGLL